MTIFQSGTILTGERPRYVVQLRRKWYEPWHTVNWLHPVRWLDAVNPGMPQAWFSWDAGEIAHADRPVGSPPGFINLNFFPDNTLAQHAFLQGQLADSFVRILVANRTVNGPGSLDQLWIGMVVSQSESRQRYENFAAAVEQPIGQQTIIAYGLAHALNLAPIRHGYVVNRTLDADGFAVVAPPTGVSDFVSRIEWAPDFNRTAGTTGTRPLEGNMGAPYLQGFEYSLPGNNASVVESFLTCFADDRGPPTSDPFWGFDKFRNQVWTDHQKALYLLFFHQPFGNVAWDFDFQDQPTGPIRPGDPLQFITLTADRLYGRGVVTEQQGRTVWQILNELAHKDLGLAFTVRCPDADQPGAVAEVVFHSRFADDVNLAGSPTIRGNPEKVSLDVSNQRNVVRNVIEANVHKRYDAVEVEGERIVFCCTISNVDGNLDQDWDTSTEQAFRDAGKLLIDGSANPNYAALGDDLKAQLNDDVRSQDRFASVFKRFKVPDTWDLSTGVGDGTEAVDHSVPHSSDAAEIFFQLNVDQVMWRHRRKIQPVLPLLEEVDYSEIPGGQVGSLNYDYSSFSAIEGIPARLPGVNPRPRPGLRLRPPLVLFKRPFGGNDRWFYAEFGYSDDASGAQISGSRLRISRDGMAIEIIPPNPVLLAKGQWAGAEPSGLEPDQLGIDWRTEMMMTVAFRLDNRIRVRTQISTNLTDPRVLTVRVAGAECWFVAPGTVVDVDADGKLLRTLSNQNGGTSPSGIAWTRGVVRNDHVMLKNVAAVAKAMLLSGLVNINLSVTGDGIGGVSPRGSVVAGSMIDFIDASSALSRIQVQSIVARVIYDNSGEAVVVTVQTGEADVNPVQVAQRARR